jgi:hypothetical protein
MDELPEFPRSVLESLRQPLEDGYVAVARVGGHALFPARFQLVGTMNMCPIPHNHAGGRGFLPELSTPPRQDGRSGRGQSAKLRIEERELAPRCWRPDLTDRR